MEKIILASNNKHKIKEFKKILNNYEILSLEDIGYFEEIIEDGNSFLENALIKARAISKFLKDKNMFIPVLADDSGLCVDSLNGAPGIYSARYAGEHGDNETNRKYLLKQLEDKENRDAHFNCTIVKLMPDGNYTYVEGKTYGSILEKETGNTSFCYDCLFYSNEIGKSFGEATEEEKNTVSHRGKALEKLMRAKP